MKRLHLFLLMLIAASGLYAQYIEKIPESLFNRMDFVDTVLGRENKVLGYLPCGKDKYPVYHYDCIYPAVLDQDFSYASHSIMMKHPVTGKSDYYLVYTAPSVYYTVMDMPGYGRFYGVVTTGCDDIATVMDKAPKDWHANTKVFPIFGTVVKPDGTRDEFEKYTEGYWKKNGLKKPAGSYWLNGAFGYRDVNLVFNADGTGSITVYGKRAKWVLMLVSAGSSTHWDAAKQRHTRNVRTSGGYEVWMIPIAKQSIRWSISNDNTISFTRVGSITTSIQEGLVNDFSKQTFSSESDKRALIAENQADFKNINEEAKEERIKLKDEIKESLEEMKPFDIQATHISRGEMFGTINGKNVYFSSKQEDVDDIYKVFNSREYLTENTSSRRTYGLQKLADDMTGEITKSIARNSDYFSMEPSYLIHDYNPIERTGTIDYILPGRYMTYQFKLEPGKGLDIAKVKAESVEDNGLAETIDRIKETNEKIMAYAKDKKRGKKVKEFKKIYESDLAPLMDRSAITFNSLDEYWELLKTYEEMEKVIDETLEYLQ